MDSVALNRVGMLLNFAAAFLLAPQLIGLRRLHRFEEWLERGLARIVKTREAMVQAGLPRGSVLAWLSVVLSLPGWLLLAYVLVNAPSTPVSLLLARLLLTGLFLLFCGTIAAVPLWLFAALMSEALGGRDWITGEDYAELDAQIRRESAVPTKERRTLAASIWSSLRAWLQWTLLALGVVILLVIVNPVWFLVCRAALIPTRAAIMVLTPGDRLPSLLAGVGIVCICVGTLLQFVATF